MFNWNSLPSPSEKRLAIRIRPAAERAVRNGHPWLFAQAIRHQSHEGRAGDLAVLFDRKDRFLAVGLYDPNSPIRVRILQHNEPAPINQSWFQTRLQTACESRRPLQGTRTTGHRLVHGENDGLPGLIIDRYEQTYVLKLYIDAWLPYLRQLVDALVDVVKVQRIVVRLSRALSRRRSQLHGLTDGLVIYGSSLTGPVHFLENGLKFMADVVRGQKTGFFLDQRENRARVELLSADKRVLNVFAYTGGFSLYAARGGSPEVTSLDISQPALESAVLNFTLNQHIPLVAAAKHKLIMGDAFKTLLELADEASCFDLVIVDPPSFAKRQSELKRALRAYARLTKLALSVLEPGGTLVMASCSSQVTASSFFEVVQSEASLLGRPLKNIEQTYHALDHPIAFREGAYLKCLFAVAA